MNGRITGLDEVTKAFENAPGNLDNVLKKAFRAGMKPVVKKIKSETPQRFRKLVKGKVAVTSEGNIVATAGLWNNQNVQGHQNKGGRGISDWFKAYWKNYGTLEGRDPSHKFDSPVRHKKTYTRGGKTRSNYQARYRRQSTGQMHENFFNEDISRYSAEFMDAMRASVKKQETDLLK